MAPSLVRLAARLFALAITPALAISSAHAQDPQHACTAPKDLLRFTQPLARTAQRLAALKPLMIVAIGSSSTFGAGASSPDKSYPSRLAVELKTLFPRNEITVVNRGVNGEEAREMLARFGEDVIRQKPDLVLWQVGTNSVLRDRQIAPTSPLILEGVHRLQALGIDVVIIDPQYAPKVIAKPYAEEMVHLIATAAKEANVDLIERFALMHYWYDHEHMAFSEFISPDGLHMNDWSYGCLAKLVAASIKEGATRNLMAAHATLKH